MPILWAIAKHNKSDDPSSRWPLAQTKSCLQSNMNYDESLYQQIINKVAKKCYNRGINLKGIGSFFNLSLTLLFQFYWFKNSSTDFIYGIDFSSRSCKDIEIHWCSLRNIIQIIINRWYYTSTRSNGKKKLSHFDFF